MFPSLVCCIVLVFMYMNTDLMNRNREKEQERKEVGVPVTANPVMKSFGNALGSSVKCRPNNPFSY